jgi:hypothetical protein
MYVRNANTSSDFAPPSESKLTVSVTIVSKAPDCYKVNKVVTSHSLTSC